MEVNKPTCFQGMQVFSDGRLLVYGTTLSVRNRGFVKRMLNFVLCFYFDYTTILNLPNHIPCPIHFQLPNLHNCLPGIVSLG